MQPPFFIALFQGLEALVLLPLPPQIWQLLRQGEQRIARPGTVPVSIPKI
jgi:hypothetical protein